LTLDLWLDGRGQQHLIADLKTQPNDIVAVHENHLAGAADAAKAILVAKMVVLNWSLLRRVISATHRAGVPRFTSSSSSSSSLRVGAHLATTAQPLFKQ
jgi:hypothetical protein